MGGSCHACLWVVSQSAAGPGWGKGGELGGQESEQAVAARKSGVGEVGPVSPLSPAPARALIFLFLKYFIYLFLERGEGREKERERNSGVREKH